MCKFRFEFTLFSLLMLIIGVGLLTKWQISKYERMKITAAKVATIKKEVKTVKKSINFQFGENEFKFFLQGYFQDYFDNKIKIKVIKKKDNNKIDYFNVLLTSKKFEYSRDMKILLRLAYDYNCRVQNMCIGENCTPFFKMELNIYPKKERGKI